MKRPPLYLQRRGTGTYYVRIAVPKDLRRYFPGREIKRSLKTGELSTAWGLACNLVTRAQRAFVECRRMAKTKAPDAPVFENITLRLARGDVIEIAHDSIEEERKTVVLLSQELGLSGRGLTSVAATTAMPLSEAIREYCEERKREDSWRPKTIQENESIYRLLLDITGDIPVSTLNAGIANHVKKILQKLPPHLHKDPRYKGRTVTEIIEMRSERTLSGSTINKYLTRLSSLFDWAERHGHVTTNPFSRIGLRRKKRADEEKDRFDDEDLTRLFESEIFVDKKFRHAHYYWLPLLGLFTGARIEELCQLHLADIREEQGIWVLDINDNGTKKLKTLSSKRLIPLHSKLIELGFLDYVQNLCTKSELRLFPELKRQRDGYSQAAQKWFNARYRRACGISEKGKSFHSFRHTFIDQLKQKGVEEKRIGGLVGHADSSITTGRYGKPFEPKVLKETVELLSYPIPLIKHNWARS